ncbi:MAG: ABC transporter substrate-binding protein [Pseudodesulfovibrio sp.]|nr:ABC transporter substrate-binding protein [Pseudodesulfovibrio sp.]
MKMRKKPLAVLCLASLFLLAAVGGAFANPLQVPERIKAVMVGDRLVDVAMNLGVVPEGFSARASMWPQADSLKLSSQLLGCPMRVTIKKPETVGIFMKEHGITRLILEKSPKFCLYMKKADPINVANVVKNIPGLTIEYVDFSKGIPSAITEIARLLDKEAQGHELLASYEKNMEKTEKLIPASGLNKRVVVLNGKYSTATGKTFVRLEAPGGYSDQYILNPLGCTNVAGEMISDTMKLSKGHVSCSRLKGLIKANPDVIVMTGDAFAVQAALRKIIKNDPTVSEVPAIKNGAVFSLPFYGDSSVIEYPEIFRQWSVALQK